ncbi:peptidase M23, partial [Lactobacillus sp. ESL0225]
MVKLQNDMASQVGLDVSGAVKSFKSLTAAVKANTAEWKANEASAKRAGDSEKAQSERIKGLSKDIELQKARLSELKKQQSEVDTSTEKGTKRYYDLQKSITQANSAIEKETSQLDKAKSGMSYYTSGLADLQKGYKQAVAVEQSYIDRLKAEGKTEEANAKQLESYKNSVDHLNKQLTIQQNELAKVASESGKSSDAYRQQEIRVNKTATSLANAKKQMDELAKSTTQAQPTGFLDKLKTKLLGTKKSAEETKTSISDIAKGSAIGTAVTGAISGLGSTLMGAAKKGFELAKAGTEIKEAWEHLGAGKKGAEELVGEIGKIRSVANTSGAEVTAAQRAIYNATGGNIKQTQALTNEIFAFGKAGGATTQQIIGASGKLTRLFSSAKVNLSKF